MDNIKETIARAEINLQRKLEWTSRYDTRIIFVAGIAIAMLGILANASGIMANWTCFAYISFGLTLLLLLLCLGCVYLAQSPKVLAPNQSLLFFGTISKLDYSDFSDKFKNTTNEKYLEDLLHQIHINSVILCGKFAYLKYAIFFIGLSAIPWGISIYLSKLYLT
ncbi:Pycsar system effector family protein [Parapedobacter defluvii]|uniref:Pycsar system effector family protein n=1 Tax=Parapedobacter defluvii TaxID=2045106 RepID=UPI001663EB2F|nr:Pycsar system effector family protein [Parapedobacter defluvii]